MNESRTITEKEFEFINIIASGASTNQRKLAMDTGVSLGMANLLLRRLVHKGYLRIQQLNRRKVKYLLTAEGMGEKARKSYHYTLKTLQSIALLKSQIQSYATEQYNRGQRHFVLVGEGPLADVADLAFRGLHLPDLVYERSSEFPSGDTTALVFYADAELPLPSRGHALNLMDALSQMTLVTTNGQ